MFWEYKIIFIDDNYEEKSRQGIIFGETLAEVGDTLEMYYGHDKIVQINYLKSIMDCPCLDFHDINEDNSCMFIGELI